jgi:hypothetical protein
MILGSGLRGMHDDLWPSCTRSVINEAKTKRSTDNMDSLVPYARGKRMTECRWSAYAVQYSLHCADRPRWQTGTRISTFWVRSQHGKLQWARGRSFVQTSNFKLQCHLRKRQMGYVELRGLWACWASYMGFILQDSARTGNGWASLAGGFGFGVTY